MTTTSTTSVDSLNAAFIAAQDKAAASAKANGSTTGTTTSTSSAADAASTQLGSDVNFFLTMLTTQLKNQDPTAPMDTSQFTAQIAQYSGVQQQVQTNSNLEKLLAQGKQSSSSVAVGYIGKEIETTGDTGLVTGGQGAFTYILPSTASDVQVKITDSTGATVFQGQGPTAEGRNVVVWDGINSATGAQEPDGVYTLAVTALDTSSNPIVPTLRSTAYVSGVETDASGNILLDTGQTTVNFNDVLAVRAASRIDTSSDTASTGTTDTSGTGTTDTGTTTTTTGTSS